MWFILDESLLGINPLLPQVRESLEPLCYSIARGEHALAGAPKTLRHLLEGDYSPLPRAVLRNIFDSAPDTLARFREARFQIRIVAEGDAPRRISSSEWTLPVEWIRLHGVPPSVVLGENTRDGEVFRVAAMHSNVVSRTGVGVRLAVSNGGGAETPRVLRGELLSKRNFVLCITDSDRQCPEAPKNKTSIECSAACEKEEWISSHLMLEEREIENFVPTNLIADALVDLGAQEQLKSFEELSEICKENPKVWAFLDLKDGTPRKVISGGCSGFWKIFKDHPICTAKVERDCAEMEGCPRERCACYIAPSLGGKIVDHVLDYLSRHSVHSCAKRASTSTNRDRWFELGALVAAWGASATKMRS